MALALADRWVLVTGASSGLGRALAIELAERHRACLVLTARRRDRLEELARGLDPRGTRTAVVPVDLARPGGVDALFAAAPPHTLEAAALAAAGHSFGPFAALDPEQIHALLALNVHAPVAIARRLLPVFDARASGGLLFVASTGGYMPTPQQAVYGGTKAFLINFVRSLYFERGGADDPVHLTLVCPGGMPTEMLEGTAIGELLARRPIVSRLLMEPERVARLALAALLDKTPELVPGLANRAMLAYAKLLPLGLLGRGAARIYDPKR
ncbi:MAG: SDR family NAD(P)-dependent oxidoreductase [Nannocystis sp.]|nr:SDR family NAD(P)-dependent oxidoreductase [Nannocystis sp.]